MRRAWGEGLGPGGGVQGCTSAALWTVPCGSMLGRVSAVVACGQLLMCVLSI